MNRGQERQSPGSHSRHGPRQPTPSPRGWPRGAPERRGGRRRAGTRVTEGSVPPCLPVTHRLCVDQVEALTRSSYHVFPFLLQNRSELPWRRFPQLFQRFDLASTSSLRTFFMPISYTLWNGQFKQNSLLKYIDLLSHLYPIFRNLEQHEHSYADVNIRAVSKLRSSHMYYLDVI